MNPTHIDRTPPTATDTALHAVLWDMDGTLVDTEPYWFRAETLLTADHGVPWTHEQATALVGNSLPASAAILRAAGVDLDIRQIIDALIDSVVAQVREAVPWRPGAREMLAALRASGVPCAMVTMSEGKLASEIHRLLPEGTFEFVISGDMVERGKPHPEPYQLAVQQLSLNRPYLSKSRIVAVEDSLPGLASATAAGVVTLGVPNMVALPDGPGHTLWQTLAGRSVADLESLLLTP